MPISNPDQSWETPTIEVRIYCRGDLIESELCETEEDATSIVDYWSEFDSVRCEVDDLSFRHTPMDVLEPEPVQLTKESAEGGM